MRFLLGTMGVLAVSFSLTACSPNIGSQEWCTELRDKPKGEWTVNELSDYTKHCLFK